NFLEKKEMLTLAPISMLGALCSYITYSEHKKFQPINSNWGLLEPLDLAKQIKKNKKLRNELFVERSINYYNNILANVKRQLN
ncbi:MAG: hypothetical protein KAQ92_08185, partial [Candidatus Aenigmarchaeota archaeon]|nr:hypothetical protein [Candidatus Aenigmarchaeota archaeon]